MITVNALVGKKAEAGRIDAATAESTSCRFHCS